MPCGGKLPPGYDRMFDDRPYGFSTLPATAMEPARLPLPQPFPSPPVQRLSPSPLLFLRRFLSGIRVTDMMKTTTTWHPSFEFSLSHRLSLNTTRRRMQATMLHGERSTHSSQTGRHVRKIVASGSDPPCRTPTKAAMAALHAQGFTGMQQE